jgi:hypothetical protein
MLKRQEGANGSRLMCCVDAQALRHRPNVCTIRCGGRRKCGGRRVTFLLRISRYADMQRKASSHRHSDYDARRFSM